VASQASALAPGEFMNWLPQCIGIQALPLASPARSATRTDHLAAGIADAHQIAGLQAAMAHVAGMHGEQRLVFEIEQARHRAGAAHAVPVVAHAAGEQADRQFGNRHIGGRLVLDGDETRLAVGGRENAILVERGPCRWRPSGIGPLLRPLALSSSA
jgi:hypothetical protein